MPRIHTDGAEHVGRARSKLKARNNTRSGRRCAPQRFAPRGGRSSVLRKALIMKNDRVKAKLAALVEEDDAKRKT
jgi:hypothetical protein